MKKILSFLLALAMLFTMVPLALAEETGEETTVSLTEKYLNEVGNRWTLRDAAVRADWASWYFGGVSAAPTQAANTQTTKLTANMGAIVKFPMPVIPMGKMVDKYILQLSSVDVHSTEIAVLKLPGENLDVASFTFGTEPCSTVLANKAANSAIEKDADGNNVAIPYETVPAISSATSTAYRNFIDVSSYVQELYNAGQRDHFYVIFGSGSSQRNVILNVTWSSYTPADVDQTSFYSLKDADPLELNSATIENGMKGLTTEKEVSFVFNNCVENATIALNGEVANSSVSGATVTLKDKLEMFEDYALEMSVTDIYGTTQSYTYEFSTGGSFSSEKLYDGSTYHITESADPASMTGKKSIDGRYKRAAVYRIPLPEIPEGEALDSFIVNIFPFSQSSCSAYKLPGDNWELTEDLNNDGQMLRYADLSPDYLNSSNRVCDVSKVTTVNVTPELTSNIVFRQTYDMTEYANECIARDEKYLDFAVYAGSSTMDIWGFVVERWNSNYKANYEYTKFTVADAPVSSVAKFASADSEVSYDDVADVTAISKSESYKAIAQITNITPNPVNVVVAIADYEDKTLVGIKLTTVTVPAKTRGFDVVSEAVAVSGKSDEAKAFVWLEEDNTPIAFETAVSVN